jgi:hypothetical protein
MSKPTKATLLLEMEQLYGENAALHASLELGAAFRRDLLAELGVACEEIKRLKAELAVAVTGKRLAVMDRDILAGPISEKV